MTTYEFVLPYVTPPLSLNDRGNRYTKARITRQVRSDVALIARSVRLPRGVDHATVTLHYAPRDDRRRDTDNLVATAKPCFDALVDAGLVPDDTPQWMTKPEPVIHPKTGTGHGKLWLEISTRSTEMTDQHVASVNITEVVVVPSIDLLDQAEAGRRVLVVGPSERCGRIFARLLSLAGACGMSHSERSIEPTGTGGWIRFVSTSPDAGRGLTCDTLALLGPSTHKTLEVLTPCVMGSKAPQIYQEV